MLSPYPFSSSSTSSEASTSRVVCISEQIVGTHLATYSTNANQGAEVAALSGLPQPVTLLIVTTKTAVTVYYPNERTCLKSWQLLDVKNRPVELCNVARFVPGVNAVVVAVREGEAVAKLGFGLASGAHKVGNLPLLAPPVTCLDILVENSLASVVVMVGKDASLTLMDVSEEQNASVIVPSEEGEVQTQVGSVEITRPDHTKPVWIVCMLLSQKTVGDEEKLIVRRVTLQQSKGMLSLLKVDDCQILDEKLLHMLVPVGGKPFGTVASLVVFPQDKIALCFTAGEIVHVSLAAGGSNRLTWTLMKTSSGALRAAAPVAGSKQLLCYVDGVSNEAKCFDVKFRMDRSSIAQSDVSITKSRGEGSNGHRQKQRLFVQSVKETAEVASVCVTHNDGTIMIYNVRLGGNSLAANLGRLRNEDSPVHVIVNKSTLIESEPDRWGKVISGEESKEKSKLKELEACGSDPERFVKLLKAALQARHMVSMSFIERALKMSVEHKLWSAVQLLVERKCVPCTRNQDILFAAMAAQELPLLYTAICYLTDIPEAALVNVLVFVLSSANETALAKFSEYINNKIQQGSAKQTRKRKRKHEASKEASPDGPSSASSTLASVLRNRIDRLAAAERGQLYLISAIMCVSCNQRFIVSALGKLDASAAEVLLSFAAHLLLVYDSTQADVLREAEAEPDLVGSDPSELATIDAADVPIPSRELCIQWCLYLFDGKLRQLVRSGANNESFRNLLVSLQEVCERNASCCEGAQNLVEPLKECLKRSNGTFSVMFKSKPSGYCVEYIRI